MLNILVWLAVYTGIISGLAFAHFGSPPEDRLSRSRIAVLVLCVLSIPLLIYYSVRTTREHFLDPGHTGNVVYFIVGGFLLGGLSIALYEVLKGDLPDEEIESAR